MKVGLLPQGAMAALGSAVWVWPLLTHVENSISQPLTGRHFQGSQCLGVARVLGERGTWGRHVQTPSSLGDLGLLV